MNLPKGFKAAIRRGERPRWPWEDGIKKGDKVIIARDSLSGEPTLTIEVIGFSLTDRDVRYKVIDLRPNLLKAALPSRPAKFDQNPQEDRDAAIASAYTDSPKRAMRGGYTRIGDRDVYIGPEPEAVSEEDLKEIRQQNQAAWEALKRTETVRRQTKATTTRIKRMVSVAERDGDGLEMLREMQKFLDKLEAKN